MEALQGVGVIAERFFGGAVKDDTASAPRLAVKAA
jgi:hypothetical protein